MIDFYSKEIQNSSLWNDWRWQFKNRLTKKEEFEPFLNLSENEIAGFDHAKLSAAVPPYVLAQMDRNDPKCPIRRQYIPTIDETTVSSIEMEDPCGEDNTSPVPGIVHRYPDRVLFLATDICAVYCRYCTRSRLVGHKSGLKFCDTIERGIDYISSNKKIRDVLISGGDPLMLSDEKLGYMLSQLRKIPHVEVLRIGSRMPMAIPQRITKSLVNMLEKFHPFYMSIHVNHPKELTPEVKVAIDRLCSAGIPLGSQSVLIKGVNDSAIVMKELVQKLLKFRIRPYYLYQCDPVKGTGHLRTSVSKGMQILRKLRGHTSGYAIPTYVIDAPGGGGKIPVEPSNVISQRDGIIFLRNWAGKTFQYQEESRPVQMDFSLLTEAATSSKL